MSKLALIVDIIALVVIGKKLKRGTQSGSPKVAAKGQQYNIGERKNPLYTLYTYTYCHMDTPRPKHAINTCTSTINTIQGTVI